MPRTARCPRRRARTFDKVPLRTIYTPWSLLSFRILCHPPPPHARMINIVLVFFSTFKLYIVQWIYVKTVHTCFKRQKLNCINYLIAITTDLDFLSITFLVCVYIYRSLFSFVFPIKRALQHLHFIYYYYHIICIQLLSHKINTRHIYLSSKHFFFLIRLSKLKSVLLVSPQRSQLSSI